MTSIGEALVAGLKARGVSVVFGIPGVHTIELYRGLPGSGIRHVTPRHEQAAGFMADGYARASGKPGVAFVITGPGVTNMLTPMAQARADSVPVLVVAGVNEAEVQGLGLGHLHELPDQLGLVRTVALSAQELREARDLAPVLDTAFAALTAGRGGPVHLQVPLDVMPRACDPVPAPAKAAARPHPDADSLSEAARRLSLARRPVILAGGGGRAADRALTALAEALSAPVVLTANARGLMHAHPLAVPASPSLEPVRALIAQADAILAVGTELGPTDYDMYRRGNFPDTSAMIRIDIDADQLARHPAGLRLRGDAAPALDALLDRLERPAGADGTVRARTAREAALGALEPAMRGQVAVLEAVRDAVPGAMIVGDSTQPVYAGNLFYDHDRPGGWFNAATGYGALGYGAPAAIGAAIAAPEVPVICLTGDGGLQFSLAELMTARDEAVNVTFLIWNNRGYGEIAEAMRAAGAPVLGCDPTPPAFDALARACGLPYRATQPDPAAVAEAMTWAQAQSGPKIVEVTAG